MAGLDKFAFIRCQELVHVACSRAVPCIQDVIQTWHSQQQQTIGGCTNPQQCPTTGKPKPQRSCQVCSCWGKALETVEYTDQAQAINSSIAWTNINPTQLSRHPVEVANAFAIKFFKGQPPPTTFDEFDTASLLLMMTKFGEFHRRDHRSYLTIKKVSGIRNSLSHLKLLDNLHISDQTLQSNFQDILDFVDCLQRLHPNHFTATLVSDIKSQLHDVFTEPITAKMRDEALKPFTNVVCQTVEEQFRQFTPSILSTVEIAQEVKCEVQQGFQRQAKTIGELQHTFQVKQQAQTTAMEGILSKMEALSNQNVHKVEQGNLPTPDEVDAVQEMETPPQPRKALSSDTPFGSLPCGMKDLTNKFLPQIEGAIVQEEYLSIKNRSLQTSSNSETGELGKQIILPQPIVTGHHTNNGHQANYGGAHIHINPYRDPAMGKISEDSNSSRNIHKWRQQLKDIYLRERQEIRFGRGSSHVADMEDLYVDLELIEEQGKPDKKRGRKHLGKGKGLDSDKGKGRSTDNNVIEVEDIEGNANRKKLGSYRDMFKIKNKNSNHLLLFGAAGSGKTTQINKIAYDWAENIDNGSADFSLEELPIHVGMDLVFVLDMHKFKSNQTLAEALKRQLLPGASIDDIDHVIGQLGYSCLIIFDGFDEISKGVTNHALDCSQVKHLFVIATTRSHIKDQFCRKNKGYAQIQVCGFSSKNVAEYIKRFFDNMEVNDLASSLIEKVNESLLLQTLSSFPVLLVMICLVWEKTNKCGITFHSMTNLYKEFMTKQYLNKPFEDRDKLSENEIDNVILTVGKTALVALLENNIIMQEGHFEDGNMLNRALYLGFMIRGDGKLPGDISVSFIHKTFQEYCAAFYLCSLFDKDKDNFQSNLSKIGKHMINHMEYMLRFCCGLSLEVAKAICKHVVCLVKTEENPWKVPLMLLYEVELTYEEELAHDFNSQNKYNFHNELGPLCVSTNIDVPDADFLAAIVHFTGDKYPFPKKWLNHVTSLNSKYKPARQQNVMQILYSMPSLESTTVGVQALTSEHISPDKQILKLTDLDLSVSEPLHLTPLTAVLSCMPALKTLHLEVVQLIGDMQYSTKCVPFSKYLTELWLMSFDSGKVLDISVELLLSFLGCMPALTELILWNTPLTGDLDDNHVTLSKSLKEFTLFGSLADRVYNIKSTQLASLLRCMPALTKVILEDAYLTGDLDDNHVTLSASLREFTLFGCLPDRLYTVNVTQLVSLLRCMPALTKVILWDAHLTSDLNDNHVILSRSLREFVMAGCLRDRVYNVNVTQLVSLLSCMPALTEVTLQDVHLTGDLQDNHVTLSASLREFTLFGSLPDRLYTVNVTQLVSLLRCMPALTKVILWDAHLTGDLNDNHVILSRSVREFVMAGCLRDRVYNVNVTQLVSLLSCMPALTEVTLQDVHLTGDLEDNHVTLSKSLKEFTLFGSLADRVYNVNVTQLVSFLSCMPRLQKVELRDAHLTGDLDDNYVTLSASLREFILFGNLPDRLYTVNVPQLVSVLSCMPRLQKVRVHDAHLTGDLDNNHVILSKSLKMFTLFGCFADRVYYVNVTQLVSLLSCMPALTEVILEDAFLTGDLNDNHVTLSESLREFSLVGNLPDRVYNVKVTQLVSLLSCMPALTKIALWDAHLTGDLDDNYVTLSESLKEFTLTGDLPDRVYNVNVTDLVSFLSCMPALTEVALWNAHLSGELDDNHVTLSESLKRFALSSNLPDRVYNVNVTQLVSLLSCMPALTKVTLQDAHLTGNLDDNHVILCESLMEFSLVVGLPDREYNVNVIQLVSLLSCMPALNKVSLWNAHLTGELDDNHVTLSESLKKFALSSNLPDRVYNVNVTQLVSLLSCMPALTKVTLQDAHLTGNLDDNHVILSESLMEFSLVVGLPDREYNVNVIQLVSLLSCMPALNKVSLWNAHLTGDLDDNHVTLSEFLREFVLGGVFPDKVFNFNVTQLVSFLSCMPALTEVTFRDVHLTGDLDDNLILPIDSVKQFTVASYVPDTVFSIDVLQMVTFLGCFPSLENIGLTSIQLAGELEGKSVSLSESVKEVWISSPKQESNIDVKQLVNFLSCMPSLEFVGLHDVQLTGNMDGSLVTLSKSLHRTVIGSRKNVMKVDVTQLCSILSCMPSLKQVKLTNVHLTGEVKETSMKLSESLKELWISGCDKGCPDYCGGEWCGYDANESNCKKGDDENEKRELAHSDKETGEQGEEKEDGGEGDTLEVKKEDDCVQELSHDNQGSVSILTLESFLRCMQYPVCVKLNRVAVQGTLDEVVNNILPVQEFSSVDCNISSQVVSMILTHENSVKSLQLTGFKSQFAEDEVRRIFTIDRMAFLNILKLDHSISESVSGTHHIVNTCLHNLKELYPVIHNKDDQTALFDFILDYCSRELRDSSLPLRKFGIFSDIGDMFSKFMSVLQCMPNLRGLDLRRVGLQQEQFQKLALYLSSVQYFQEILISDADYAHLMPILAQSNSYISNLSDLRLRNTGLTDDGITQLPWSKLSQLTELDLSCNNIGSEGAVIFSEIIRTDHVPLLQHLNLGNNVIGSEGMSALAKSFSHLPLMKMLNLACDMVVRPEALEDVFRNLVYLSCLEVLDLRGPHVVNEDWKDFPVLVDCCRLVYWDPSTNDKHIYSAVEINVINEVLKKKC